MNRSQIPQVAVAKKAAATKASGKKTGGTPAAIVDRNHKCRTKAALAGEASAKPERQGHPENLSCRLLSKAEVLAIVGVSFPTIWSWMRAGKFPRARISGSGRNSKSVWRSDEVEQWLAQLPVRKLKGD
jgi:predicted DNA-binding transcriptional regulator AlpA